MTTLQEPTADACNQNAVVFEDTHHKCYALWYPQMGGYTSKAIAIIGKQWRDYGVFREGGCVDLLVWHDGEFPFSDGGPPRELHHCDPFQFIELGRKLSQWNNDEMVAVTTP